MEETLKSNLIVWFRTPIYRVFLAKSNTFTNKHRAKENDFRLPRVANCRREEMNGVRIACRFL
jgi:hypothetical protein